MDFADRLDMMDDDCDDEGYPIVEKVTCKSCERKKMKVEFFMPMIPPTATAQEKAIRVVNGKPYMYDTPEINAARQKLEAHLSKHVPESPYVGAVQLTVKWLFPITGNHVNGEYKTTRPDTDNLEKLLKDIMTHIRFWKDDSQVASEIIEKFWADRPGIYICITEL